MSSEFKAKVGQDNQEKIHHNNTDPLIKRAESYGLTNTLAHLGVRDRYELYEICEASGVNISIKDLEKLTSDIIRNLLEEGSKADLPDPDFVNYDDAMSILTMDDVNTFIASKKLNSNHG